MPRAGSWQLSAGIQGRIQLLQGNHGPLVAGAADQLLGTGLRGGSLGPQPQAIGLQGQLQSIARLQPQQLAQPGRNHQLPLGGEGEESVHDTAIDKRLTRVSQLAASEMPASFAQVISPNWVAPLAWNRQRDRKVDEGVIRRHFAQLLDRSKLRTSRLVLWEGQDQVFPVGPDCQPNSFIDRQRSHFHALASPTD